MSAELARQANLPTIEPVKPQGLELLRAPFAPNQISKLPKPTKQQTEMVRADYKIGIRCTLCGAWHHPQVAHLDYVGHAALTDRLLEADLHWNWEPVAVTEHGLPMLDAQGGLWIRLTVCGVTRYGYGSAAPKNTGDPGDTIKELIGDALRNAAMRFGAALDLWHKGSLHAEAEEVENQPEPLATAEQISALCDYAETDFLREGQKAWLKAAQGKITQSEAAYVLKKCRELEAEAAA